MKREYPILWAAISKYVATPITLILGLFFVASYHVSLTITELATICVTAFGVLVSLAGLSFSVKCDEDSVLDPRQFTYAGAKLSHSSVLCLQLLFVVLARHVVATTFANYPDTSHIAHYILKVTWTFVSTMAMWTAYWGIACLNQQFFADWSFRVERLNNAKTTTFGTTKSTVSPKTNPVSGSGSQQKSKTKSRKN